MTVIVAVVDKGVIYMGGDRASIDADGYGMVTKADAKVFKNGEFIMGVAGSPRVKQVLRYKVGTAEFPLDKPGGDIAAYMNTTFVDAARAALEIGGSKYTNSGRDSIDASFLVGYQGVLFQVYGDFYVQEPLHSFAAAGIGDMPALGVLFALQNAKVAMSPVDRVRLALEAAHEFNASCRPPFDLVTSQPILKEMPGITLLSPYQAIYA